MVYAGILDLNAPNRWLPQLSLSSRTKLHHTASYTLLTQTFINPSSVLPIASAKYSFPLYESCAIVSFKCYIGARLIEGTIKEKEDASATYHAALSQNEPASLLEQHTYDVFSTSLGNVPAGERVKVEIGYVMELKHDAEVDGLRFTIPTCVAPRYGEAPAGVVEGGVNIGRMTIEVEVSMSSNITSVQSPSHPISVHLGGFTQDTSTHFNPQQALTTISLPSTSLSTDFILLIKCASLSSPCALLEAHPTIPNSSALMVTLVPKFNLPSSATLQQQPEVVFVVDRSGSMAHRVTPLKSALSVFLKSIPVGVNFNICSFGSSHSFLWPVSQPYTSSTFAEAQSHCDAIDADMGGTEILPPIRATMASRLPGSNLEVMVLTDGEVWNSSELFAYVEAQTSMARGDVRVFSLGIGADVSHALIDGLARAGKGFSQVVSGETEGIEGKVMRMLRGALSLHIGDYRLEWEGKPGDDEDTFIPPSVPSPLVPVSVPSPPSNPPSTRQPRRINLWDTSYIEPPLTTSPPPPPSPLPAYKPPQILQTPYKLQPLFPFSRSTAYAILTSPDTPAPTKVWLRGTTPEGDLLELEIPVQTVVGGRGDGTIHQLAARRVLGELKDGTSYLHKSAAGIRRREREGERAFGELIKREGVSIGLKYGVAGEWTSFVAVVRQEEEVAAAQEEVQGEREGEGQEDGEEGDDMGFEFLDVDGEEDDNDDNDDDGQGGMPWPIQTHAHAPAARPSAPVPRPFLHHSAPTTAPQPTGPPVMTMMMTAPPPPSIPYPTKSKSKSSFSSYSSYSSLAKSCPSAAGGGYKKTGSFFSKLGGSGKGSLYDDTSFGSQGGMGADMYKDSGYDIDISTPTASFESMSDASILATDLLGGYSTVMGRNKDMGSDTVKKGDTSPSSIFGTSRPTPMFGSTGSPGTKSSLWAPYSKPPPPPVGASPPAVYSSSPLSKPMSAASRPSLFGSMSSMLAGKKGRTKPKLGSPDSIAIAYTPPSTLPAERLSSETATQPLSLRTRALIDLQTYEGCFKLDSTLAPLVGVSITDLEAQLAMCTVLNSSGNAVGLNEEQKRKVWATVFAIKVFEVQLAAERSVWGLVVDKARAWMKAMVGDEDAKELEELAGKVLGV